MERLKKQKILNDRQIEINHKTNVRKIKQQLDQELLSLIDKEVNKVKYASKNDDIA